MLLKKCAENCLCGKNEGICYVMHGRLVECFSDFILNRLVGMKIFLEYYGKPDIGRETLIKCHRHALNGLNEIISFIQQIQYYERLKEHIIQSTDGDKDRSCTEKSVLFSKLLALTLHLPDGKSVTGYPDLIDDMSFMVEVDVTDGLERGMTCPATISNNAGEMATCTVEIVDILERRECDGKANCICMITEMDDARKTRYLLDYSRFLQEFRKYIRKTTMS